MRIWRDERDETRNFADGSKSVRFSGLFLAPGFSRGGREASIIESRLEPGFSLGSKATSIWISPCIQKFMKNPG